MDRPGIRQEDHPRAIALERLDAQLSALESRIDCISLEEALEGASAVALALIKLAAPAAAGENDLLPAFSKLAHLDPSWNAVRENLRELVYYRNCMRMDRRDALPEVPQRMAIRLARHLHLYFKSRLG